MATMHSESCLPHPTQEDGAQVLDVERDRGYLQWRYNKVLGYHNESGNTLEEIAAFARELDRINAQIRALDDP